MFSIARLSCAKYAASRISPIVLRNTINTNTLRTQTNLSLWRRSNSLKFANLKNAFRGTGTVAVRLASDICPKAKKAVGYWLLGCSGMVFVAVVLGIGYYFILTCIFIILEEVVKRTVR